MATKTWHDIQVLFESQHGASNPSAGYTTTVHKSQKGNWVAQRWYQRSSWSDKVLEKTATYTPDGIAIGTTA